MDAYEATLDTPVGQLRLLADDEHLTHALWPTHSGTLPAARPGGDHPILVEAIAQLNEYFSGKRRDFDLPIEPKGTTFQRQVWAALQAIPWGETWSYGDLAAAIERPRAVRAVGAANGRNPLSIIVPCHRVLGRDGALTGYAGGLLAKRWLLQHEATRAQGSLFHLK